MSTANVKKAFVAIVAFLEQNVDKKVKSILPDVIAMCAPKVGGGGGASSTFVRNDAGDVVAVRCFYHKLWMSPLVAEFGSKSSSATGLNSMCKDGVSKWTKQQADFKKAQASLLQQVGAGEIAPADIAAHMESLEAARKVIVPREDGYGFATAREAVEHAQSLGHDVGTVSSYAEEVASEE